MRGVCVGQGKIKTANNHTYFVSSTAKQKYIVHCTTATIHGSERQRRQAAYYISTLYNTYIPQGM